MNIEESDDQILFDAINIEIRRLRELQKRWASVYTEDLPERKKLSIRLCIDMSDDMINKAKDDMKNGNIAACRIHLSDLRNAATEKKTIPPKDNWFWSLICGKKK